MIVPGKQALLPRLTSGGLPAVSPLQKHPYFTKYKIKGYRQ